MQRVTKEMKKRKVYAENFGEAGRIEDIEEDLIFFTTE